MEECHDLNLVKYDILGLKSVGVIDKTLRMIGKKFPKAYQVDWNDEAVLEDIANDSTMLFQFESDFAKSSIKKMQPKSVEDICLCSACIRPSGESYREKVFAHEWNKNPSKLIDNILKDSYGFLVYQEQTIAFLQQVCGFSGSEADNIRRAIGQKNKEKIAKALPKILEGYCNKSDKPRDIAEEEAKQFIKVIEDASAYSFGFNHSESYAMLTYLMGWLRYHYPVEFCTAFLSCAKNDDDLLNGTKLARLKGCTIEKPKFGVSSNDYGCDPKNKIIYKGIASIKDMQATVGDELYNMAKGKKYNNFLQVLFDIKTKTRCNSKSLDILIKLDYFSDFGDINYLLNVVKLYNKYIGKNDFGKTNRKQFGQKAFNELYDVEKEAVLKFETSRSKNGNTIYVSRENIYKLVQYLCGKLKKDTTTIYQKIYYEATLLGYTSITLENSPYSVCTAIDVNQYGTPYITLYNLRNGLTDTYKANRKFYKEYGIEVGDIVEPVFSEKNKRVKVDDEWVKSDEKYIELTAWSWKE
jgi:DNA polymerase-3 subunit alpha